MKTLLLICCLATSAVAQIPDAELDKISREDIVATLKHLQQINAEAQKRATAAEQSEARKDTALTAAEDAQARQALYIDTVEKSAKAVEDQRDALGLENSKLQGKINEITESRDSWRKRSLIQTGIILLVLLGLALFLYLKIKSPF